MGQQQLLLLVLSVVLVGLAVVSGIQGIEENRRKSVLDAYTIKAVTVASDIIAWHQKPTALGGNRGREDLSAVRLEQLGYEQSGSNDKQTWDFGGDKRVGIFFGQDSTRPHVEVREDPISEGSLMVRAYLYGPDARCIAIRRSVRTGRVWAHESLAPNPDTDLCSW